MGGIVGIPPPDIYAGLLAQNRVLLKRFSVNAGEELSPQRCLEAQFSADMTPTFRASW